MRGILLALACLSSAARIRRQDAAPFHLSRALTTLLQAPGEQAAFNPSSVRIPHQVSNSSFWRPRVFSSNFKHPGTVLMSDERRMDKDGSSYTKTEFEQFYGDTWQQYWDAAMVVDTETTAKTIPTEQRSDGLLSPEERQELLVEFQSLLDSRRAAQGSPTAQDEASTQAISVAAAPPTAPVPAVHVGAAEQVAPASSTAKELVSTVEFAKPQQFTVNAEFKVSLGGKLSVGDEIDGRLSSMDAGPEEAQVICRDSDGKRIQFEVAPAPAVAAAPIETAVAAEPADEAPAAEARPTEQRSDGLLSPEEQQELLVEFQSLFEDAPTPADAVAPVETAVADAPAPVAAPAVAAVPLVLGSHTPTAGAVEKRIDKDGSSYTQKDFQSFYGSIWQQRWDAAKPDVAAPVVAGPVVAAVPLMPVSPAPAVGVVEKRIDNDGSSYTQEDFQSFYGSIWQERWDAAKSDLVPSQSVEQKQADVEKAAASDEMVDTGDLLRSLRLEKHVNVPEASIEKAPEAAVEKAPEAAVERAPEAAVEKAAAADEMVDASDLLRSLRLEKYAKAPEAAVEKAPEAAIRKPPEVAVEKAAAADEMVDTGDLLRSLRLEKYAKAPEAAVEKAPEAAIRKAPEVAVEKASEAAVEKAAAASEMVDTDDLLRSLRLGKYAKASEEEASIAPPVPAAPAAEAPVSSVVETERRIDSDGSSYTQRDFQDYYGEEDWQQYWDAAKPVGTAATPADTHREKRTAGPLSPEDREELLEQFRVMLEAQKAGKDIASSEAAPPLPPVPVAPAPVVAVPAPAPAVSALNVPSESMSTTEVAKQDKDTAQDNSSRETIGSPAPRVMAKVTVY